MIDKQSWIFDDMKCCEAGETEVFEKNFPVEHESGQSASLLVYAQTDMIQY
jgi:hypothetical protein